MPLASHWFLVSQAIVSSLSNDASIDAIVRLYAIFAPSNALVNSDIYTTKIYGVVCPPNISETVAGRLMKLAHRQR